MGSGSAWDSHWVHVDPLALVLAVWVHAALLLGSRWFLCVVVGSFWCYVGLMLGFWGRLWVSKLGRKTRAERGPPLNHWLRDER